MTNNLSELKLLLEAGENLGDFGVYWVTQQLISDLTSTAAFLAFLYLVWKLATKALERIDENATFRRIRNLLGIGVPGPLTEEEARAMEQRINELLNKEKRDAC